MISLALVSCREASPRLVEDFNFGWSFTLGDCADFSEPGFDDSSWRALHLPHDWSVEGEFAESNPSTYSGGALPGGVGWYRKHFSIDGMRDSRFFVEFDGVFMDSDVYVNGNHLGNRPYGYSSFSYEITSFLKEGENVIAVRCDNSMQPNSRWYAGCGIYRDVRLVRTGPAIVKYNGLFVRTEGDVVSVRVETEGEAAALEISVQAPDGGRYSFPASGTSENGVWASEFRIPDPLLWDTDNPQLYTISARLSDASGRLLDVYSRSFGFRDIRWEPESGFSINGRTLKLKGVCLHHDLGCIGSAFYPRAMEKRLLQLKAMGCNAIRTSHNPPAPGLLDLCDRLGILVVDEVLDVWRIPKTEFDYAMYFDDWYESDIRDMVRRDRNHPSVILWSAGNELPEQYRTEEYDSIAALAHRVVSLFKMTDPTRPVTVGIDYPDAGNVLLRSGAFDVLGLNYRHQSYDELKAKYPDAALFGSEIASALQSRGWYPQPSTEERKLSCIEDACHQCPSYDNTSAVWSDLHSRSWTAVSDRDFIAGGFVWTGFDYLGEPTPYRWPSRSSYFGIFDLAGFPKDSYYMYKSEWTDDDVLHLFPHWNWKQGDSVDVWCYCNHADEVELLVNGKSMGKTTRDGEKLHFQWLGVPYEEGEIRAVAYRGGKAVMECLRETTGAPRKLCLSADRRTIKADGYDLCYVTVTAVDSLGREVPTAIDMLRFRVSGAGELFGVDNGNAADTLCLKGDAKALFAGRAIAVVRSDKGHRGRAVLTVESDFDTEQITIRCK